MAQLSPLRRRMIEDMTVRNMSPATQRSYVSAVSKFSRYFGKSPERLSLEDVRAFQVHLVSTSISWPSLNQIVCDLRFFYGVTLGEADVPERIPYAREPRKLGRGQRRPALQGLRRPWDRDQSGGAVRIFEKPDFDQLKAERDSVDIGRNSLSAFWLLGVASWTQHLARWWARPKLKLRQWRQAADGVENDALDGFRRDPRKRSGFFLPTLIQNARDIIAVAHSFLYGVGRRHRVAPIIEQFTYEQSVGALTPPAALLTILGQLSLDRFEQARVDDRRMLAAIALIAMVDLAEVHSVA
jgi:hypothetical protein